MIALLAAGFLLSQLLYQVVATEVECGGELPSGYVKYPDDNTAHKFHTEALFWHEARERCISEGADLAVATTPEKIRHIQNRGGDYQWIGIHRLKGTRNWLRVDTGLPVTSLPWTGLYDRDVSNCASTMTPIGRITDRLCINKFPFVCEISLAEDCPGPAGPPGLQVPPGFKGDEGFPGLNGSSSEDGKAGEKESDGSRGVPGEKGSTGDAGTSRPRGLTGPAGIYIVALLCIVY